MAVEVKRPPRPASLERVLAAHHEEAARLREELGDPAEALSSWVREHYNREDAAVFDLLQSTGQRAILTPNRQ